MRNGFVSWFTNEAQGDIEVKYLVLSFTFIIFTFQVVIGGLALIAILAITLGITLTADRNRSTSTPAAPLKAAGEPITFNDYINSNFRAKYFNGSWFSDNQLQWRDLENNLGRYTYFEKNFFYNLSFFITYHFFPSTYLSCCIFSSMECWNEYNHNFGRSWYSRSSFVIR